MLLDEEILLCIKTAIDKEERLEDRNFSIDSGSGTTRTLSVSMMPLVREGGIQGNILHVEDVTEKKKREARLRRAESLASLTTLAAGVAHEIKNPLGSIGIHIQLMQKEINNNCCDDPKVFNKYLDIVNEEIERLNGIVVDFLFAVRPMDINPETHNVNKLLSELCGFVQYELENSHIKLVTEFDEEIPEIEVDEKYFKQAFLNLVKNSLAAMPEGGILKVATEEKDDSVYIIIKDTGIGIPEENLPKVFEPFFTTKEFGSGLGLTLVYKIIKESGGDISLKSKEGEGTEITITFPIPQKEQRLLSWREKGNEI